MGNDDFPIFGNTQYYKGSTLDTTLESTVYNGFTTKVKNALNYMNVASNGGTIQRHVVAPSVTEVGCIPQNSYYIEEGIIYPIFSPANNPNTKSIYKRPNGSDSTYWVRSRYAIPNNSSSDVYAIIPPGYSTSYTCNGYYTSINMVARIRFAKA